MPTITTINEITYESNFGEVVFDIIDILKVSDYRYDRYKEYEISLKDAAEVALITENKKLQPAIGNLKTCHTVIYLYHYTKSIIGVAKFKTIKCKVKNADELIGLS